MRQYTRIYDRQADGTWVAYLPAFPEIDPVTETTKNRVKQKIFCTLISHLKHLARDGQPIPRETLKIGTLTIDETELEQYDSLEDDHKTRPKYSELQEVEEIV